MSSILMHRRYAHDDNLESLTNCRTTAVNHYQRPACTGRDIKLRPSPSVPEDFISIPTHPCCVSLPFASILAEFPFHPHTLPQKSFPFPLHSARTAASRQNMESDQLQFKHAFEFLYSIELACGPSLC